MSSRSFSSDTFMFDNCGSASIYQVSAWVGFEVLAVIFSRPT